MPNAQLASGGSVIFIDNGLPYQGYNPHATPTGPITATVNGVSVPCPLFLVQATDLWVRLPAAYRQTDNSATITINAPGVTNGPIPVLNLAGAAIAPHALPPSGGGLKVGVNVFRSLPESGRIFGDLMRIAGPWTAGGGPVQAQSTIVADARGYPQSIVGTAPTVYAPTANSPGSIPAGNYLLRWTGSGSVTLQDSRFAAVPKVSGGTANGWSYGVYAVPANNAELRVVVAPAVSQIELWVSGCWDEVAIQPTHFFDPGWEGAFGAMDTLRFMDAFPTNYSTATTVADLKRPLFYTDAAVAGVPNALAIETMCEIANHFGQNVWLNIPQGLSPPAVYDVARRVARSLRPGLKCYVAWANEVWNFSFTAYGLAKALGLAFNPALAEYPAVIHGAAQMAVQTHNIFRSVFAAEGRAADLKCTLEWKAQDGAGNAVLLIETYRTLSGRLPDVYAVAPYIPAPACNQSVDFCTGGATGDGLLAVADLLDSVERGLRPTSGTAWWMNVVSQMLAAYPSIELAAYEAGHNISSAGAPAASQAAWTAVCLAATQDPRMGQIAVKYLAVLAAAGFKLVNWYTSIATPAQVGMWGMWAYQNQPVSQAPILSAVQAWNAA